MHTHNDGHPPTTKQTINGGSPAIIKPVLGAIHHDDKAHPERFIKLPETLHLTGVSASLWYEMIKAGKAPPPVKVGKSSFWVLSEVINWQQEQIASSRKEAVNTEHEAQTPAAAL